MRQQANIKKATSEEAAFDKSYLSDAHHCLLAMNLHHTAHVLPKLLIHMTLRRIGFYYVPLDVPQRLRPSWTNMDKELLFNFDIYQ